MALRRKGIDVMVPRRKGMGPLAPFDDDEPNVAASAGPAPAGAVGGDDVLAAARNRAETGQVQATPVTESMRDLGTAPGELASTGESITDDDGVTILDGGAGTGGGGTTYGNTDPDAGGTATGEIDPYKDFGSIFEDYARAALGPQDTSEEEALIRELMEQQQGMDLWNSRAAAGRSGFSSSGAQTMMEGDIRRRAAQAASGDILDLRRQAEEDAFGRAVAAAGISLDEARFASDDAYRQAVLDAMQAVLDGQPPPPPGEDGGGETPTGGPITIPRTDEAREQEALEAGLHTPGVPEGESVAERPSEERANIEATLGRSGYEWETVTDDGVTVYRNRKGDRFYVRYT